MRTPLTSPPVAARPITSASPASCGRGTFSDEKFGLPRGARVLQIKLEIAHLEPALVLTIRRAAVEAVDEHEIGRRLRAGSYPPAFHARHGAEVFRVRCLIPLEISRQGDNALIVLAKRLKLDPGGIEGEGQAGSGNILHLGDRDRRVTPQRRPPRTRQIKPVQDRL